MVIIKIGKISEFGNKELQHDVIDFKDFYLLDSVQKSGVTQVLSYCPNKVFKSRTKFGKHDNISLEPASAQMKLKSVHECSQQIVDVEHDMLLNVRKHRLSEFISLRLFSGKNTTKPLHNEYSKLLPAIKVLLTTLVVYLVFFCRKSSLRPECEIKTPNVYEFVFQFRHQFIFEFNVYHFSLKKYLSEIERKSDKNAKRMHHEWARYESFKTFPQDCAASSLRLAQSGFYYTGKGVEAICFCCGLKNENWTNNESVFDLHKRLSPNCKFMNGDITENVPIHGSEKSTQHNASGACGGPDDLSDNRRGSAREQTEHRIEQTSNEYEVSQETGQNLGQRNTYNCNQNSLETAGYSLLQNGYSGRYSEYQPTEEIQHFPGITNEQPKHPDYAIRSVRLSSFLQWPSSHVMKPDDLAEAGFFFTGIQDLVRCFFCGGGMKHWEYGDSPWIEHARWFPTCAYLKQCKGEDFVNLCQMSNMTISTQTNFELRELDAQQSNTVEDQYIRDLNSIAAKRVLDMGYTQTHVEDAIRQIRQGISPAEELKAQYLLEYLLDNSSTRDSNITVISTPQQHTVAINNTGQSTPPNTSQSGRSHSSTDTTERLASDVRVAGCQSADQGTKATKDEKKSLKEENQHLKEQMMCKICMDKDANIVFLPCGHLVSCVECAHALRKCAVCRTVIQGTVRAYPA